eukprot:TRINITY_DN14165_c0_g1_i1.p1 TRINITY_DN14165_c0_g1~~TRINITY_DN14165_c0_g1_i1.p1  ORF type:complete len:513 (+),score=196.62 TRINITY_DN14165_c0_g1_i1:118-1656(+)
MAAPITAALPTGTTESEDKIFSLLLDVNKQYGLNCTLRVAGGWVRDRLLGIVSDDIDIALEGEYDGNVITGAAFCEFIVKYQADHGLEQRHVGVIKANPDQSKHLETATTHIYGEAIDFVNLRCEEYAESRIPTIKPGTPKQDAERRDLTINALFYNLHTQLVEDYTTGLQDMDDKLVRTPLAPLVTFHDDPLRLLRCIRFACRLMYAMHEDIKACARDPDVHESLRAKISRERVGIEVRKMLSGAHPDVAVHYYWDLNVVDCIFEHCTVDKKGNITGSRSLDFTPEEWVRAHRMAEALKTASKEKKLSYEVYLAAIMSCHAQLPATAGELEPYLAAVITHGLKLPIKVRQIVQAMILGARHLMPVWEGGFDAAKLASLEAQGTPMAAHAAPLKATPRVLLCEALQLAKYQSGKEPLALFYRETCLLSSLMATAACDEGARLVAHIDGDALLQGVPSLKAVLNGGEVGKLLGVKGPEIRPALAYQLRLQFEYPSAGKDEMQAALVKVVPSSS